MLKEQQINNISKNLGFILLNNGVNFIQKAYINLRPAIFSYGEIRNAYNNNGFKDIPVSEYDVSYAFLNTETLEPLIWDVMTLIHKFGYKLEFTDCDNFAHFTTALMSFLYGINTCGTVWGDVYDNQTGKFIAGHYFNVAITYDPVYKKFEMWLCDSLNPGFIKIQKGNLIIMGSWEYRLKKGFYF